MLRSGLLTLLAVAVVAVYRLIFHVNQTTVALTFLVLVLVVASRWQFLYSVYLSLLCTLLYNFFFLPPLGTLTVSDPQNWIALLAFLGAAIIVSHLAESEHRQAVLSEQRRADASSSSNLPFCSKGASVAQRLLALRRGDREIQPISLPVRQTPPRSRLASPQRTVRA